MPYVVIEVGAIDVGVDGDNLDAGRTYSKYVSEETLDSLRDFQTKGYVTLTTILDSFDNVEPVTDPEELEISSLGISKGILKHLQGTGVGSTPVKLIDSIIPESHPVPANILTNRSAYAAYRAAVIADDILGDPVLGVTSGQTITDGELVAGSTYKISVCAVNAHGTTIPIATVDKSPGDTNNAIRVPITQLTGATGYIVFLSTDAAPKMVCQITEAQRAAGCQCIAMYTISEGGAAGAIDIGVVGTGLAYNVAPFAANTALNPDLEAIPELTLPAGKSTLKYSLSASVADFRVVPSYNVTIFYWNATSEVWLKGTTVSVALPLNQLGSVDVSGSDKVKLLITGVIGQGLSVDIDCCYH